MGISKRMRDEGLPGPSPLKPLEAPECKGPHPPEFQFFAPGYFGPDDPVQPPYPATLSPIGWDCQEGGRGPYRGPLSDLEREVALEVQTNRHVPLPGQTSWLDNLPKVEPAKAEPDVVRRVVKKARRRVRGPAKGQLCFLELDSRKITLEDPANPAPPKAKRARKRGST